MTTPSKSGALPDAVSTAPSKHGAPPSKVVKEPHIKMGTPPVLTLGDAKPLNLPPYWVTFSAQPGLIVIDHREGPRTFRVSISGSPDRVDRYFASTRISVAAVPAKELSGPISFPWQIEQALRSLRPDISFPEGRTYAEIADGEGLKASEVLSRAGAQIYEGLAAGLRKDFFSLSAAQRTRVERPLVSAMQLIAREPAAPPVTAAHELLVDFTLLRTHEKPQLLYVGIRVDPCLDGVDADGYTGTFSNWVQVEIDVTEGQVDATLTRLGFGGSKNAIVGLATPALQLSLGRQQAAHLAIDNAVAGHSCYSFDATAWKQTN